MRLKGLLLVLVCLLTACGQAKLFVGQYAVSKDGPVQFRISSDGSLYVLEKRHGSDWGDRRELGKIDCPPALAALKKTLEDQQPTLICLGRGGTLAAALLHLDKPQGNWQLAHYYLIIGLPLPLYKVEP